jgi:N-acyl-D-amino-acid deacylase
MIQSLILVIAFWFILLPSLIFCQEASQEGITKVDSAIQKANAILKKGVENYPSHRSCFSCHHQALPLFALSIHDLQSNADSFHQSDHVRSIGDFSDAAFAGKRKTLQEGGEIGGRALTVAYGLWAMDLAGTKNNPTTDAMVEYLLKVQDQDGGWKFHSYRPPASSSRLMTSAVAVYGLRSYAHENAVDHNRLFDAFRRVQEWSRVQVIAEGLEDQVGQLWLEHMVGEELSVSDNSRIAELTRLLLAQQRSDGGWAQTPELASDPYATGQAVTLLAEVSNVETDELQLAFRKGVDFLLKTQESDGSWHVVTRAKPVQVYFDNGDPHGKDQFISMMATSWSVAALKTYLHQTKQPLASLRVVARRQAATK